MQLVKEKLRLGRNGTITCGFATIYLVVSLATLAVFRPIATRLDWAEAPVGAVFLNIIFSLVWLALTGAASVVGGFITDAAKTAWARINVFTGTISIALISTLAIQPFWVSLVNDYSALKTVGSDWLFVGSMIGVTLIVCVGFSAIIRRFNQRH